jgi:hypothetical protein
MYKLAGFVSCAALETVQKRHVRWSARIGKDNGEIYRLHDTGHRANRIIKSRSGTQYLTTASED